MVFFEVVLLSFILCAWQKYRLHSVYPLPSAESDGIRINNHWHILLNISWSTETFTEAIHEFDNEGMC